jgi:hypothetical protein
MSSKVEPVPIAISDEEKEGVAPADRGLRRSAFAAAVLGASALFFVSACSSKNPDALPGMNVDENLAMMDANAAANTNVTANTSSEPNSPSAGGVSNRQERSGDERSPTKAPPNQLSRVSEINSVETGSDGPPDRDETDGNQVGNDEGDPNDVQ